MVNVYRQPAAATTDEPTRSPALQRLAEDIKRLRLAEGLSQPQLGIKVGFTKQYISLAERGTTVPSEDLVQAIDKALGADGELVEARARAVVERKSLRTHMATSLWPHEQVVVGDITLADMRED